MSRSPEQSEGAAKQSPARGDSGGWIIETAEKERQDFFNNLFM
jgi:hypothetical protein